MAVRILRGLSSARLACGCSIGVYETYSGETVHIVDARHGRCTLAGHREGEILVDPRGLPSSGDPPRHPSMEAPK